MQQNVTALLRATSIVAILAVLCCGAGGCLQTKSYVDPQYRQASIGSLQVPDKPVNMIVTVEFQTNGKCNKPACEYARRAVCKVLLASRAVRECSDGEKPSGTLAVTLNNVANVGEAAGKGFVTGLTYGAAGSHVVDNYVMTAVYTPQGAASGPATRPKDLTKTYRHAIHTTIGLHKELTGLTPVPGEAAFDMIVEDMVVNLLLDLQKESAL